MRHNFSEIGRRFQRAVQDAARTGRLDEFDRAVRETAQDVAQKVNQAIGQEPGPQHPYQESPPPPSSSYTYGAGGQTPPPGGPYAYGPGAPSGAPSPRGPRKRPRKPGRLKGLACMLIGWVASVPLVMVDICLLAVGATGLVTVQIAAVSAAIFLPLTAVFLGLAVYGTHIHGRSKRYQRYCDCLGPADFISISELANAVGRSPEAVIRELRWMIRAGWFPTGHLDAQKTCLIVDDETYEQYLEAERAHKAREEAARKKAEEIAAHPEKAALEEIRKEGKRYLEQIRAANDAIPGEDISQKLYQLEAVTGRIFDCVEDHPEKLPDIRHFMQYYLPTTLKLVLSYQKFDAEPVQGETIRTAKQEIAHALDTINSAFANLLDRLFADEALDLSTDIAALEAMLKQEGLAVSDFGRQ